MSRLFQPIPAKPTFGVLHSNLYASDYIQRKKAKIAFCNELQSPYCKKVLTQNQLLNFKKGEYNNNKYKHEYPFNKSNLIAGLYTKEQLTNIITLCKVEGEICQPNTIINPLNIPFYNFYKIDPEGELFGNTLCGINNYTNYMIPNLCNLK